MTLPKTNKVSVFVGFQSDAEKAEKINCDRLSDHYPELFKKEYKREHFASSSTPLDALLTGEFVLPCSIHSFVYDTYKSKTPSEIVGELELLLDKLSNICANDSDFVKLLHFTLALLDCFGNVIFGCEEPELRTKLVRLHERVKSLTSARFLFLKNMSLIKNTSAFVPSVTEFSDYVVEKIRMCEL